MKIQHSKQFLKDVSRLNENQMLQLRQRLRTFEERPSHPTLNNHRLKGKLKGYCSINISGDLRALYRLENEGEKLVAKFVRLGTHSQLYA